MSTPKPLALSDSQLDAILRAAGPLPPDLRAPFLEDVARALAGRELGDGIVARTCAEVQKRYWKAPDLSRANGTSRWR
jgi:hypothetical protein